MECSFGGACDQRCPTDRIYKRTVYICVCVVGSSERHACQTQADKAWGVSITLAGPSTAKCITCMCHKSFSLALLLCGSAWPQALRIVSGKAIYYDHRLHILSAAARLATGIALQLYRRPAPKSLGAISSACTVCRLSAVDHIQMASQDLLP